MPQIIPVKEMRNTAKLSEMCHMTNEPIFITKNGYGDMAVLSMEAYGEFANRMRIHDEIMKGIEQLENGELLDGEEVMEQLREKYGRKI